MKFLGTAKVKLSKLTLPGDIKARMAMPHVRELADSIEELGCLNPPILREWKTVVAGRDRVAAHLLLGRKEIEVRSASGTDLEIKKAEIHENLRRRSDDRDKLISELVALTAVEIVAERAAEDKEEVLTGQVVRKVPASRPKTEKGEARERVAKEVGTTPEAVRKAERRAAAAEAPEPDPDLPSPPCIETLGMDAPEVLEAAAKAQAIVDEADKLARKLTTLLGTLYIDADASDEPQFFPASKAQKLKTQAHELGWAIRQARPAAVCPYCKLALPKCGFCLDIGHVDADTFARADKQLLVTGKDAVVFVGGKPVLAEKAAASPPPAKAVKTAKAAKKIKVVDADDKPLPTDDDFNQAWEGPDEAA